MGRWKAIGPPIGRTIARQFPTALFAPYLESIYLRQMAEEARVRVRANRRTAVDEGRKMQKASELTEDGLRDLEADVQKLTDKSVKEIDDHLERKEAEVMKI